jgi:hypothetical protein
LSVKTRGLWPGVNERIIANSLIEFYTGWHFRVSPLFTGNPEVVPMASKSTEIDL